MAPFDGLAAASELLARRLYVKAYQPGFPFSDHLGRVRVRSVSLISSLFFSRGIFQSRDICILPPKFTGNFFYSHSTVNCKIGYLVLIRNSFCFERYREGAAGLVASVSRSVVHEPSGLESFESGGASSPSPLESRSGLGSSPLESLGGSRVLAGAVAAWAPLLCPERNFTQNKRKYLPV